jgi:nucleoid DNA-binding protein
VERLVNNITRLIAQHNCVILPGIGAFLAHQVPAFYNAEDGIFMPPHRALGFNPQVTVDDALLMSEYMNSCNVSCEDATTILARDINRLKSQLSSTGTVRFGELGTFTMNIKGEISFEPNENGVDDPYNFGFEPLAIPLLNDIDKKDIVIKRRNLSRYISVAAAIIISFFVLSPIGNSVYENGIQASVVGFIPAENVAKQTANTNEQMAEIAPVEDTVTKNIITENINTGNECTQVAVEERAADENTLKYSIIVASTPSAKNARKAIRELSTVHKADYTVVRFGKRHRIAIETLTSESEAEAALARVQAIFPKAWIYIH